MFFFSPLFLFFCTLSSPGSRETFLSESPSRSEKIILISPSFPFHLSASPGLFFFSPLSGITVSSFFLPKLFPPLIAVLPPLSLSYLQQLRRGCASCPVAAISREFKHFSPLSHAPKSIKVPEKKFYWLATTFYSPPNSSQLQPAARGEFFTITEKLTCG